MTWTKDDTGDLRDIGQRKTAGTCAAYWSAKASGYVSVEERAADHIEALESEVLSARKRLDEYREALERLQAERVEVAAELAAVWSWLDRQTALGPRGMAEVQNTLDGVVIRLERKGGAVMKLLEERYALSPEHRGGYERGKDDERETIVEWLRKAADTEKHLGDARFGVPRDIHDARRVLLVGLIGEIERGEHLN